MGLLSKIQQMEQNQASKEVDFVDEIKIEIQTESIIAEEHSSEISEEPVPETVVSEEASLNKDTIFDDEKIKDFEKLDIEDTPILELESMDDTEFTKNEFFSEWAERNGYNIGGVFCESYGYFVLCDMFGLHAETAVTSLASADFWMGSLEKTQEWEIFTEEDGNIGPFYQLFCENDRYEIKRLCVLPRNILGQNILVFFATTDEFSRLTLPAPDNEEFIESLKYSASEYKSPFTNKNQIEKNLKIGFVRYPACGFIFSVKIALDNIVTMSETENTDIKQIMFNCMYTELVNEIQKHFAYPNSVTRGIEGDVKVLIFANGKIEEDLLKKQLEPSVKKVLGKYSQGTVLIDGGSIPTIEDAQKFLF